MAKKLACNINSCDEHRRKNDLPVLSLSEKENIEYCKRCPVVGTCEIREICMSLQTAFHESE